MTSLRCYTCNTTHVDRFSKEVTYSNACAERWSMMMVMVKTINIVTYSSKMISSSKCHVMASK